jgi:hypothetical protein
MLCSVACGYQCLRDPYHPHVQRSCWYQSTKLHTVTSQKITIFILTAVATPNLRFCSVLCDGNITGSFICQEITGRSFILTNNKTQDRRDQHSYLRCSILFMAHRILTIHADKLKVSSGLRNQSFSSQNTTVEPAAKC